MLKLCYMMLSVLQHSTTFFVLHDILTHVIHLSHYTLLSKFKIKKIEIKTRKQKKNGKIKSKKNEINKTKFIIYNSDIIFFLRLFLQKNFVANFIQLVSLQLVNQFLQAPNEGYLHIYGIYKSNNKQPRYQAISNCKNFIS